MMRQEKEWLLTIRPTDFIFKRNALIDIQAYTPLRFEAQLGFSQGVVGSQGNIRCRFGSLQDARYAWELAMPFDTDARYVFLEYQEQ